MPGYITNRTWFIELPRHTYGKAVWYGRGVMEATAAWRGMSLDGYRDGVALMSCRHLGDTVWIWQGGRYDGPFLVVDCPRRGDAYSAIVYTEEVAEVGWETAVRWGMVTKRGQVREWMRWVTLWVGEKPPRWVYRGGETVTLREWWLERVEFATRWEDRPVYYAPDHWRCTGDGRPCWGW